MNTDFLNSYTNNKMMTNNEFISYLSKNKNSIKNNNPIVLNYPHKDHLNPVSINAHFNNPYSFNMLGDRANSANSFIPSNNTALKNNIIPQGTLPLNQMMFMRNGLHPNNFNNLNSNFNGVNQAFLKNLNHNNTRNLNNINISNFRNDVVNNQFNNFYHNAKVNVNNSFMSNSSFNNSNYNNLPLNYNQNNSNTSNYEDSKIVYPDKVDLNSSETDKWLAARKRNYPYLGKTEELEKKKLEYKERGILSKLELKLREKISVLNRINGKISKKRGNKEFDNLKQEVNTGFKIETERKKLKLSLKSNNSNLVNKYSFKYRENNLLNDLFKEEKNKELGILLQAFTYFENENLLDN